MESLGEFGWREKIKLFPTFFEFEGIKYSLDDITHLSWYSSSKPTDPIIINITVMIVHLRERSSPIKITGHTDISQKLTTAYDYIAQKTFKRRLRFYLDQLDAQGYFSYDGANFFSDGIVESKIHQSLMKVKIQ